MISNRPTNNSVSRILHVLGRLDRGGTEMRTLELMRNLNRARYRFEFCCLSGMPGELDDEVRSLGGVVHLLPLGVSFPNRFRRLLRQGRFDTVHSHVQWPSGYIVRLAALEGIPQRICEFASTWDGKRLGIFRRLRVRLLKRWVDQHSTDILGVSEATLEASFGPKWSDDARCRVIYRGVDTSRFHIPADYIGLEREFGIPNDAVRVIHVGRMDTPKNHERLLCIFEEFLRLVPRSYLLLVGAAREPIASQVRRRAREMAIGDRVVLAGVRRDVPRLLRSSTLMIFPSLWEGLPGAVLEAVAAGLPVVATDLSGIIELARHLPGIITMSLQDSNWAWVQAAASTLDHTQNIANPEMALLHGPFSMSYSVASLEQLYSRCSAPPMQVTAKIAKHDQTTLTAGPKQ